MSYISIVIEDAKGARSNFQVHVDPTTPAQDVADAATALAGFVNNVITGQIVAVNACLAVTPPAGVAPAPGVDVEEGARFIFDTPITGVTPYITIPTFDESFILPNSIDVDLSDPTIIALTDALTAGVTAATSGNTVQFEDYRGADFVLVRRAYETFAGKRGRL